MDTTNIRSVSTPNDAAGTDAWLRGRRYWELAFAGVLVATCVVVGGTHDVSIPGRVAAIALLSAQVPGYLLVGRSLLARESSWQRQSGYLLLLLALFLPASALVPAAGFALFALAPLCYMITHPAIASIMVVALNIVPIVSIIVNSAATGWALVAQIVAVAAAAMLSFTFGMWIYRIVLQSRERADLVERLAATRAELAEVSRHAGVLEERRRMARDIHDTLAQGFSGIAMLLQAAEAEPDGERRYLRLAQRAARTNLDDARALVAGSLDLVEMVEALREAVDRLAEETSIAADFAVTGTGRRLEPRLELATLRVLQESLANVRKHAAADRVEVELAYLPRALRLRVRDDGRGFDAAAVEAGHGLAGMRERIAELDGRFTLDTAPGAGATVTVELPT